MNPTSTDPLENLLKESRLEWMFELWEPGQIIDLILQSLNRLNEESRSRLGDEGPQLTREKLVEAYDRNPHRVRAFLQAMLTAVSPQMLLMVWRILQGAKIIRLEMTHQDLQQFRLKVVLRRGSGKEEHYESEDITDAGVVRHFGIIKRQGKPRFDGFFQL